MCLAVPGKVLAISGEREFRTGSIGFGGIARQASLAYLPEAKVGDYVLVHAGFAVSVLEAADAMQTFEYLKQMGELGELDGQT
jgi:hydrogenase expression/formation protein HypC